jgi:hypothetical protein
MQNVGSLDRILRAILGVILLLVAFVPSIGAIVHAPEAGLWHWVIAVIGVVMLATSAIRFCPLYRVLGLRT